MPFVLAHPTSECRTLHPRLLELVCTYALGGGMPAAVAAWVDHRSFTHTSEVHRDLLWSITRVAKNPTGASTSAPSGASWEWATCPRWRGGGGEGDLLAAREAPS